MMLMFIFICRIQRLHAPIRLSLHPDSLRPFGRGQEPRPGDDSSHDAPELPGGLPLPGKREGVERQEGDAMFCQSPHQRGLPLQSPTECGGAERHAWKRSAADGHSQDTQALHQLREVAYGN